MIYLVNQTPIDLDAIRVMGVNVKESEGAIGHFGTGLKYAIATLLRTGHSISLERSGETFHFSARPKIIRGKLFMQVYMNDEALGFTTELGKQWEVWMAFREFYSNMLDEGGAATTSLQLEGYGTIFRIAGEAFTDCFHNRHLYFIENRPTLGTSTYADIHEGRTSSIFYRGVRVAETEKEMAFTYNLTSSIRLTEDRTAANPWELDYGIRHALGKNATQLRIALLSGGYEAGLNFASYELSDAAKEVMIGLIPSGRLSGRNAELALLLKEDRDGKHFETYELPPVLQETVDEAFKILSSLNCPLTQHEIKFVRTLGPSILGLSYKGEIYIASTTLDYGAETLAATLYEEYLHRDHGYADESRELQNFLFQKLITLVKGAAK